MTFQDLYLLSIQSTYHDVQIAVCCHKLQLKSKVIKKIDASADLVPLLNELLNSCSLTIQDLSFIVVNQGPAPFTTLRVVIASMNGIGFATGVPLIGVDGIKALLQESSDLSDVPTIALLDAFAGDVYYAFKDIDRGILSGCMPIVTLLQEIKTGFHGHSIRFVGNGAMLHKDLIIKRFADRAIISESFSTCSLDTVTRLGLEKWRNQQGLHKQLLPLYLKKQWWQEQTCMK